MSSYQVKLFNHVKMYFITIIFIGGFFFALALLIYPVVFLKNDWAKIFYILFIVAPGAICGIELFMHFLFECFDKVENEDK